MLLVLLGERGVPVVVRAPSTASIDATNFSLALGSFLIGAAPGSTFGWGSCWFDHCWSWQKIYGHSLGAPLAHAMVSPDGMAFTRRLQQRHRGHSHQARREAAGLASCAHDAQCHNHILLTNCSVPYLALYNGGLVYVYCTSKAACAHPQSR